MPTPYPVPAISIVIPCFNQGQYLADALGSIAAQTLTDWEIVVVDDGSTDAATRHALDRLSFPQTRVVRSANQGLPAARNLGISHATGRYILPLDCDDKIAATYLEKAVALLEADPGLGIVYCQAEFFGAQSGRWPLPPYRFPEAIFQPAIFCSGVFRRSDWQETGGYSSDMTHGYEDHDFWLSLIKRGRRVHRLEETLFFYRRTPQSMAQVITVDQQVAAFMAMFRHHRDLFIGNIETLFRGFLSREALSQVHHMRPVLQLFGGTPEGYSENVSIRSEYAAGDWAVVTLPLPAAAQADAGPLRLDPGMQTGCYEIAEVQLLRDEALVSSLQLSGAALAAVRVEGTAVALPGGPGSLQLLSFGSDPQVILHGLPPVSSANLVRIRLRYQPGLEPAAGTLTTLKAAGRL